MKFRDWQFSECSCSSWLKHYKCNHVIATAVRLKLATWQELFLDTPLEKKNKRGAKKKTKSALMRQSIEPITLPPRLISQEEEWTQSTRTTRKRTRQTYVDELEHVPQSNKKTKKN